MEHSKTIDISLKEEQPNQRNDLIALDVRLSLLTDKAVFV